MHHCQKLRFCQAGAARLQTTCSAVIYLTTKYELQGPPSVKKVEMEYSQHSDYSTKLTLTFDIWRLVFDIRQWTLNF